ncbi:MAG: c-type cytochrome [Bryobacterales bacterium]|nr:c-type cytochrome [Bryobacterales bacterium]MDE0624892.1 c-type cytochrome [Bryobacterales bacterium]
MSAAPTNEPKMLARPAAVCGVLALLLPAHAADGGTVRPTPEQARNFSNPVAYSQAVAREGRKSYLRLCQYCHGADGRAQANPDFEAPSLRAPDEWRYGTTDGELFVSIKHGAGHDMPPFSRQLEDERIWELVHYLRSIGPREQRPVAPTDEQ